MSSAMTPFATGGSAMRHDPASAAVVVMLRGLKMYGTAQAVGDLLAHTQLFALHRKLDRALKRTKIRREGKVLLRAQVLRRKHEYRVTLERHAHCSQVVGRDRITQVEVADFSGESL